MKVQKVCAIKGPAGKKEVAGLIQFAVEGWNIAFMDPYKDAGKKLKQDLKNQHNITVRVVNGKEHNETNEFDI